MILSIFGDCMHQKRLLVFLLLVCGNGPNRRYCSGYDIDSTPQARTISIRNESSRENTIMIDGVATIEGTTQTVNTTVMEDASEGDLPLWSVVIDRAQLGITSVGFIANLMTLITLHGSGIRSDFNPVILLILRHQSTVDGLVCLSGTLLMVFPPMWRTDIYKLDVAVCHLWHSQALYWLLVFLSSYSLILIAIERYHAVCLPFKHQEITVASAFRWLAITYVLGIIFTSGATVQTRVNDSGSCVSEYLITGKKGEVIMAAFAISTWFTFFSVPALLFGILYGRVVYTFHKRKASPELAESRIIDKATTQLTKTAIVVTVIFIISLGYDLNYYVLGYIGVAEYKMGSPLQKVAVLFAMFNSCANPFVYTLLMPVYRKHMMRMFCCFCQERSKKASHGSTTSMSTASTMS